ncbi:MAG: UDP-N-acetylglucosamine 2-epimerase (non-hydrolyzing) [Cryobacterium sp.]|nr:UDP-N-acetylglucosamine 2-epimerase (non-hydrolyzing) [Cryobacterium sp.]
MKVMSVVGARPQFVKLAPISHALEDRSEHLIVHTGQHYDPLLSEVFFRDLGIPRPEFNLEVGSSSHAAQTAAILSKIESVMEETTPDWVLVYGDTNSTIAAALSAVKLGIPLAHLEAGLRSYNRAMPEEHNRVLTDHASDLCLAPSDVALKNLTSEGLGDRSKFVGDVMVDVLLRTLDSTKDDLPKLPHGVEIRNYYVCTIHRPSNTDDPTRLSLLVEQLASLDKPVLMYVHPRLAALAGKYRIDLKRGSIFPLAPLPYPELVITVRNSAGVITDSGGLQKEAFIMRVPCTTVREDTEWVETVQLGWNVLAGGNLSKISDTVSRPWPEATSATPYGDGEASKKVVDELLSRRS